MCPMVHRISVLGNTYIIYNQITIEVIYHHYSMQIIMNLQFDLTTFRMKLI